MMKRTVYQHMAIVRERQGYLSKFLQTKTLHPASKEGNKWYDNLMHTVNHERTNIRRMYQYVWWLLQLQRRNQYNQCICNAPYFPKVLLVLTNKNQTQL
ncbi:hypothetical protein HMPREF2531_03724 [Bacteroides intestinalis]|uniref:Uncharacterized protein n=1 Tax=Bacteroides intestinalis TaxID=329854 RepID=A0A139L1A6_9BACE|nr:hypothetical protein HMPREF2531_03724 [Bacteroides intestinalis]